MALAVPGQPESPRQTRSLILSVRGEEVKKNWIRQFIGLEGCVNIFKDDSRTLAFV